MSYKVEVVGKDNLSKVRYIGNDNMKELGKVIELDEFRDIANRIMSENPKITYDRAFLMAKNLRNKKEYEEEQSTRVFEQPKVKVLTINKNA